MPDAISSIDRYAVIGNPVAHSKSPAIHSAFANQTGQRMTYGRILAPIDAFTDTAARFVAAGGKGLNVTVPFKIEAYELARKRSTRAEQAGACNTLVWKGRQWFGDNTDGVGLVRDLQHNLGITISGRKLLLLGAGGAARGVIAPLLATKPAELAIANRTPEKAHELCRQFAPLGPVRAIDDWVEQSPAFKADLIINATSSSLASNSDLPWPPEIFENQAFAYDLVYADTATPFLRWAKENGACGAADGLGMLIEQAAESFFIWRGVRPDTAPVFSMLRKPA